MGKNLRTGRALLLLSLLSVSSLADSLSVRDFQIAKSLLDSGKENEALVSFTDFLRKHPNDALSDDAQYWLGEIYFRRRQFTEAIVEFRKVIKFPKGDRLADAYLRVGESQQRLGDFRAALIEFEAVRRRFPGTKQHEQSLVLIDGLMKTGNRK